MRVTQITVTVVALALAGAHLKWPNFAIDSITSTLFIVATVPWLAPLFKSIKFGGLEVELQDLRKATQDQATTNLYQTIATVISWVQAEEIRQSRRLLYDLEKEKTISRLPADQWEEDWKQAADRVSQAFNSAAIIVKLDPRLQEIWISPTRRAILRSWGIVQPRIQERRKEESDLWKEFEWLAEVAARVT